VLVAHLIKVVLAVVVVRLQRQTRMTVVLGAQKLALEAVVVLLVLVEQLELLVVLEQHLVLAVAVAVQE
jgi:hypothetical protein